MKTKRELINTITIIPSNLEYIAKPGSFINGTLLLEIERVMNEYADQVSRKRAIKFASNYIQVEKELIEPEYDKWRNQL